MKESANCIQCNKLFMKFNKPLCTNCIEIENKEIETIKKFLKKNPQANLQDIISFLNVTQEKIEKYLKERRLRFNDNKNIFFNCYLCEKPIKEGKICSKCHSQFVVHKEKKGTSREKTKEFYKNKKNIGFQSDILKK